jgi:hypothetical protein
MARSRKSRSCENVGKGAFTQMQVLHRRNPLRSSVLSRGAFRTYETHGPAASIMTLERPICMAVAIEESVDMEIEG